MDYACHTPALTPPQALPVTPARLTPPQHLALPALAPPLVSLGTPARIPFKIDCRVLRFSPFLTNYGEK